MILHAMQFAAVKVTTTTSRTSLYTVPAGNRIILRSVVIQNLASSAAGFLFFAPDPLQAFFRSMGAHSGGSDSFEWRPWLVLGPGDVLSAQVGNATGMNVIVSGSIYFI